MRHLIALTTLALTLSLPAQARQSSDAPRERPDIELLIPSSDIFLEMATMSTPLVPYALRIGQLQKLLSRVMFETKAPSWDINYPRSIRDLRFNGEMLRNLRPSGDTDLKLCLLCNAPGRN